VSANYTQAIKAVLKDVRSARSAQLESSPSAGDTRYEREGELAVNLYGVPRVTQDINIIIATDKDVIFSR
jgi:hypothetical protein